MTEGCARRTSPTFRTGADVSEAAEFFAEEIFSAGATAMAGRAGTADEAGIPVSAGVREEIFGGASVPAFAEACTNGLLREVPSSEARGRTGTRANGSRRIMLGCDSGRTISFAGGRMTGGAGGRIAGRAGKIGDASAGFPTERWNGSVCFGLRACSSFSLRTWRATSPSEGCCGFEFASSASWEFCAGCAGQSFCCAHSFLRASTAAESSGVRMWSRFTSSLV